MSSSNGGELLQLQWNSYSSSWHSALATLRTTGQYCDLTLVVDDGHLLAHRAVVSSCSSLLSRALAVCHHPHPALVLRGVSVEQMRAIMDFMYMGETKVGQKDINTFLKAAEELGVTGLSDATKEGFIGSDVSEATMNEQPIEQRQKVKKSKKRPRSDLTSNLTTAKKCKKDKKHCDNESTPNQKKSPTVDDEELEGLKEPVFTFKTEGDMGEVNTKVEEPVIVFKKVLTPNKHTSDKESDTSTRASVDDTNDELTITISPRKKPSLEVLNSSSDRSSEKPSPPKHQASGDVLPSPTNITPSKSNTGTIPSPSNKTVMTNLPQDRAKLRDIWDTLVAPEEVEGETGYCCLCCDKKFKGKSAKSNAWSHVDHNHTNHIEHKCHICDFTGKSNDAVSRHISKNHRKEPKKDQEKVEDEENEEDMIVLD